MIIFLMIYAFFSEGEQLDQTKTEGIETNISSVDKYLKGLSEFIMSKYLINKN